MEITISSNRMLKLLAITQLKKEACFNSFMENSTRLWHCRFGHLSFSDLKTLQERGMVRGMPCLAISSNIRESISSKKHMESFSDS